MQAVRMRSEMSEYQRLMFEELNRIAESYKSDLDVAKAREKACPTTYPRQPVSVRPQTRPRCSCGSSSAKPRLTKISTRPSFSAIRRLSNSSHSPDRGARHHACVTAEVAKPSQENTDTCAVHCHGRCGVGTGLGAFREIRDRFFRTGDQIRDTLKLEFLGMTPMISATIASVFRQ